MSSYTFTDAHTLKIVVLQTLKNIERQREKDKDKVIDKEIYRKVTISLFNWFPKILTKEQAIKNLKDTGWYSYDYIDEKYFNSEQSLKSLLNIIEKSEDGKVLLSSEEASILYKWSK